MDQIDNCISNQPAAAAEARAVRLTRVSEVPAGAVRLTRDYRVDYAPCKIEEGLFLGSITAAKNKDALKALNITYILTVAKSLVPSYPNDFVYRLLPVLDLEEENIKQYFDECYHFIDEAIKMNGRVLVHCYAGISRSVTIVVAYLMKKHRMSLSQALEHVKSRRPCADPNAGFISQLEEYEKALRVHEEKAD